MKLPPRLGSPPQNSSAGSPGQQEPRMERDGAGAQLVEEGDRGKQPTFRSFRSGFSLRDIPMPRGCTGTGSTPFNILLLLCFLTCILLFSVTLIKYSELTAEMKRGQPSALNLTQTLDAMGKSTVALTKLMAFMCNLCPVGWLNYNNTCYLFSSSKLVHQLAREACQNQGAHLLNIENQQEMKFLAQNTNSKGHWMDLSDVGSEGDWHWGNGKRLTYSNWNAGEPNNDKNNEDCAELLSNGYWNDIPCSHSFNYICKRKGQC